MRKIKDTILSQLLMQLGFAPEKQRKKQLASAERLLGIIDKKKVYPYEFVCFHITGYRPKGSGSQHLIEGAVLAEDLPAFIAKLSGQVVEYAAGQAEKIYTLEELADKFRVSAKTVNRWKKQGLVGRRFIFADGGKRFGFSQSAVERFVSGHPEIAGRAGKFKRLSKSEKVAVIKRAIELAANEKLGRPFDVAQGRQAVIRQVAKEFGRAVETIRYTLADYERLNPNKRIFERKAGVVGAEDAAGIYRMYREGESIGGLMKKIGRSKSSIYRLINQRHAKEFLGRTIEFVANEEFMEDGAQERIIGGSAIDGNWADDIFEKMALSRDSTAEYPELVKRLPVLDRETERGFFRRYNYLKYLVCVKRSKLKPSRASAGELKRLEGYLDEAEKIRRMLAAANLRLVVSVAGKHSSTGADMVRLIAEGNAALMRAIEGFDYGKGFRFGTYASWVIAKAFASMGGPPKAGESRAGEQLKVERVPSTTSTTLGTGLLGSTLRQSSVQAGSPQAGQAVGSEFANFEQDFHSGQPVEFYEIDKGGRSLEEAVKENLDQREQYIIINRFGLRGSLIKKNYKSRGEISEELGISREQVRRIELVALQKLKHSLSMEEYEQLTG